MLQNEVSLLLLINSVVREREYVGRKGETMKIRGSSVKKEVCVMLTELGNFLLPFSLPTRTERVKLK